MNVGLVTKYGPFWARNAKNFEWLRKEVGNSTGIYLLYCGWFPVYVGRGKLVRRISDHTKSTRKVWDRFTWFVISDPSHCQEMEAIFLRSLPFYLRLNNKQGAHVPNVHSCHVKDEIPETISLPKMLPRRRKK